MRQTVLRYVSLIVTCATLTAGCSGQKETEAAVATPSMTFNKDRVAIGSAMTVTYKFVVAPTATFDKDYWVFVHVLDPDGEQMWTEDHLPPVPTSKWKAGETIEYKRTIFVPSYPYIGEAVVRLGMYDPPSGKRLVLTAPEASRRGTSSPRSRSCRPPRRSSQDKDRLAPGRGGSEEPAERMEVDQEDIHDFLQEPEEGLDAVLARREGDPSPAAAGHLRIGDQVVGQFAADAKAPALKTFSSPPPSSRTSDMVDPRHRRRQDVPNQAESIPRAGHSRVPRACGVGFGLWFLGFRWP
jgi:hypothetical protein